MNEQSSDFFLSLETAKKSIEDLVTRRRAEKMKSCYYTHYDNFDHYAKCVYSFERMLSEKRKHLQFSSDFFRMHIEKCLSCTTDEDTQSCLARVALSRNSIFHALETEISSLQ